MTVFENPDAFAELYYTMQAIQLVTGVTPTCWRPPYGDVDDRIRFIADSLGLRTIIWQYNSNDWEVGENNITEADVDANYQALIDRAQNGTFATTGTIMLTHELNNYTMQEAMNWYSQLKSAFTYIVPVLAALNQTQPYVESNITGPTFQQYIDGQITTTASNSSNSTSGSGATGSAAQGGKTSGAVSDLAGLGTSGLLGLLGLVLGMVGAGMA